MKTSRVLLLLLILASLTALPARAKAQSPANPAGSSNGAVDLSIGTANPQPGLTYTRPTETIIFRNYLFDVMGSYPIVGSALTAGIDQVYNSPPEWKQGMKGYGKRFGSDFGIAAVTTTTRYALAEVFREDTLYYRCECKGLLPRLRHAALSTLISRRGADGHSVFSFPALAAPYAGTMTAVYGWYPGRYDAKDAFRMGNYTLLLYVGGNISVEFLLGGPRSLISRMHLNNTHVAPSLGSNP